VYHVDASSAEPVGGIARFQTVCKFYQKDPKFSGQSRLVTVFSGDAFNPSLESSVTKGVSQLIVEKSLDLTILTVSKAHMVPVLNNIGTDVAAVGNHDLDFGIRQYRYLTSQCKFPWLLANVLDPALGENVPLGNADRTYMFTSSNGIKIGFIGLAEREWLDTINSLPPNLIYMSASATAKELVPGLREQGAEIVICITHQREPNDNKLAENMPSGLVDLILGYVASFMK
jgi:5'-nucleotidase